MRPWENVFVMWRRAGKWMSDLFARDPEKIRVGYYIVNVCTEKGMK